MSEPTTTHTGRDRCMDCDGDGLLAHGPWDHTCDACDGTGLNPHFQAHSCDVCGDYCDYDTCDDTDGLCAGCREETP